MARDNMMPHQADHARQILKAAVRRTRPVCLHFQFPWSRQFSACLAIWFAVWQGGASVLVAGVLESGREELYTAGFFVLGLGTLTIVNSTNY